MPSFNTKTLNYCKKCMIYTIITAFKHKNDAFQLEGATFTQTNVFVAIKRHIQQLKLLNSKTYNKSDNFVILVFLNNHLFRFYIVEKINV